MATDDQLRALTAEVAALRQELAHHDRELDELYDALAKIAGILDDLSTRKEATWS